MKLKTLEFRQQQRFEFGRAIYTRLQEQIDYHLREAETMSMRNPPHPDNNINENCLESLGLNVTEAAVDSGNHLQPRIRYAIYSMQFEG